jgi:LAS superfamily LD-carboxypeptidase LdcB
MPILRPEELTGRARTHVMDVPEPRCTLHPEVAWAFQAMRAAATRGGLDLVPASSFRDFERQLAIWNDKFEGRRPLLDRHSHPVDRSQLSDAAAIETILIWSALPGASRHHWGTEVDVIDQAALAPGQKAQLLPAEFAPGGPFERLDRWLTQHAASFGFFRPYDVDRGGVLPEPWHLSYAPVSYGALSALTVEVLAQTLRQAELAGAALVHARLPGIYTRYVAAVAQPSGAALAAPGLNPATRPS